MTGSLFHWKPLRAAAATSVCFLGLLLLSGCGQGYPASMTYPVRTDVLVTARPDKNPPSFGAPGQWPYLLPTFEENKGKTLDPSKLSADQRGQFEKSLTQLFGTPAEPKVAKVEGLDETLLKDLRLDDTTLADGSRLYRRHCLHCHGLTGDGHGPTSAWVNPHPRDYRPGKFKFTSSSQSAGERKPRREDLLRVLRQGVEGTSMPSFGLLPEEELQKLASYVIHLSLRGQCEFDTMSEALSSSAGLNIDQRIRELLVDVVGYWRAAESKLIVPAAANNLVPGAVSQDLALHGEMEASIIRGHRLFLGATGGTSCISCHKDYGRQPNLLYDDWGTVVRPADLTMGIYRGGRRPIDIFWRIHSGVNGTGMPAYPETTKSAAENDRDMWDVVNFVLALPYQRMLPKEVRDQIYGSEKSIVAQSPSTSGEDPAVAGR